MSAGPREQRERKHRWRAAGLHKAAQARQSVRACLAGRIMVHARKAGRRMVSATMPSERLYCISEVALGWQGHDHHEDAQCAQYCIYPELAANKAAAGAWEEQLCHGVAGCLRQAAGRSISVAENQQGPARRPR